ncbi:hypothetical protein D3C78_1474420 [compost metagenome]
MATELGLMSMPSMLKALGFNPASSKAMASEYGSSPVEHGKLSSRNGRAPASSARRLWARPARAVKESG